MFHSDLMNANARAMTEQRVREMQNVRAVYRARTEERARRRRERLERRRPRRDREDYGRAV
ncbi:hypothetical protein A6A08_23480 [Nocardiopsis sp. TSRI0078]|uniref:hypothetical protein n=1 Tax=unclassified Nocardiopsis TaxID=2649073 RepID=UPI00093B147F|nr:hypothetical protein [Nocardiopsis sp. TSRI0078]OKI20183.1 hypothetical protein A6A08_23480 [Nocardiopsis sp. TSRI0078]